MQNHFSSPNRQCSFYLYNAINVCINAMFIINSTVKFKTLITNLRWSSELNTNPTYYVTSQPERCAVHVCMWKPMQNQIPGGLAVMLCVALLMQSLVPYWLEVMVLSQLKKEVCSYEWALFGLCYAWFSIGSYHVQDLVGYASEHTAWEQLILFLCLLKY